MGVILILFVFALIPFILYFGTRYEQYKAEHDARVAEEKEMKRFIDAQFKLKMEALNAAKLMLEEAALASLQPPQPPVPKHNADYFF
jgi:hypothetical protein